MNEEQRNLISDWIDESKLLLHTHLEMANTDKRKHRKLGILAALLSGAVGAGILGTIGMPQEPYVPVLLGAVSLVASILVLVVTFLNKAEVALRHQQTGAGFAAIEKELEEILAFPPENESDIKPALEDIRTRWSKLRQESVPVSSEKMRRYQRKIDDDLSGTTEDD